MKLKPLTEHQREIIKELEQSDLFLCTNGKRFWLGQYYIIQKRVNRETFDRLTHTEQIQWLSRVPLDGGFVNIWGIKKEKIND